MAKKICSFTENTIPFGSPDFTDPQGSGDWITLGAFEGRYYHSFNEETTVFNNIEEEHEFKIFNLEDADDLAQITAALVNFHDINNKMKEIESRFMKSNYTTLIKKLADRDEDLLKAIADCEQEKNEYLQNLGFPGTEILVSNQLETE